MTMAQDSVNQWLAARVPGARLDDSGVAAVRRDEDTVVLVEVPADGDTGHLCALIAPLPEHAHEAALLAALELNRFGRPLGGCWIAWESDIQMLTLCTNVNVPTSDAIAFVNTLDNFMVALDQARAIFIRQDDGDDAMAAATGSGMGLRG